VLGLQPAGDDLIHKQPLDRRGTRTEQGPAQAFRFAPNALERQYIAVRHQAGPGLFGMGRQVACFLPNLGMFVQDMAQGFEGGRTALIGCLNQLLQGERFGLVVRLTDGLAGCLVRGRSRVLGC
jgi:hypothetical protein